MEPPFYLTASSFPRTMKAMYAQYRMSILLQQGSNASGRRIHDDADDVLSSAKAACKITLVKGNASSFQKAFLCTDEIKLTSFVKKVQT